MPTQNFYIPQWHLWNWRLVSPVFISIELTKAKRSLEETDNAMRQLELDVKQVEQEIKAKWAIANVQVMRGFEARLKAIRAERKRIGFVQKRLRDACDAMTEHLGRVKSNAK